MDFFRPSAGGRRSSGQLTVFAVWVAVTAIGTFLHPDAHGHGTHEQLGLPPCPTVLLFDRPCPGCGLTTSWTALIHGQIGFAFHAHPLGPILYLLFTALGWLGLYGWCTRQTLTADSPKFNRAAICGAVIFVGFGLVRLAATPHYASQSERLMTELGRALAR